jgi:hypothetical protein
MQVVRTLCGVHNETGCLQAFFDAPGHGKLLVDQRTYPLAYATNVNQPYVFEVCHRAASPAGSIADL